MLFNSYIFIFLFLPIVLFFYYLFLNTGKSTRLSMGWLLISSLFFYAWWEVKYLAVILISIFFNFYIAKFLDKKKGTERGRHCFLFIGVIGNLALLFYFKYTNFFLETISHFFENSFVFEKLILPLGISFYTFQQISFLLDVHKGTVQENDFIKYGLFITFFPQLIAGPIVHHKEMLPQFSGKKDSFLYITENLTVGSVLFVFGLFKKVVIADNVSRFSTPVFSLMANGDDILFTQAWISAIAFSFQVYFDFSGYSDMAIGLARMFGIKLPQNFNSPYKSIGGIEFWRRWHMTLGRFINSVIYAPLYMPLQRYCRKKMIRGIPNFLLTESLPLMLTFLAAGIWHGAGWNFVAYGVAHGVWVCSNQAWLKIKKEVFKFRKKKKENFFIQQLLVLISFFIATVIFIFFRSYDLQTAWAHILMLFSISGEAISIKSEIRILVIFLFLYLVVTQAPNSQEIMSRYKPTVDLKLKKYLKEEKSWMWKPDFSWAFFLSILFVISCMSLNSVTEFIYFNF